MKSKNKIPKKFKNILDELMIGYSKIIVFGSKARCESGEESDWDILVVLKKHVDVKTKKDLWLRIYKKFHEYFPFISIDIILIDSDSFEREKTIVNTISNEVYLEGVEI